jgi:NAD(P)-dependent dehydrogenase (short-subunit alcohol dehydrogenase family)
MVMTSEFTGQTAIVTGGARGIGLAIVRQLLSRGCRVAAVAVFAASPACSFTSGFTFDATGGRATC